MSSVLSQLYKLTEKRLDSYHDLKRTVEEYRAPLLDGMFSANMIQPGKSGYADPTAAAAILLADPPAYIRECENWIWAIERARKSFQWHSPEKAKLMEIYYGLDLKKANAHLRRSEIRENLMSELCVEYTTFYEWKKDILEAVLLGAVQKGVVVIYPGEDLEHPARALLK